MRLLRRRRAARPSGFAQRQARDDRHIDELLDEVLSADSRCVDVGAHQGVFLDKILARAPDGAHVAVEPLPSYAASLAARYPTVRVEQCALSDQDGGATTFFHQVDAPAWSSLAADHAPPNGSAREEIAVPLRRLDTLVDAADFVKVDVEGGELGVLQGAARLLENSGSVLLFEHAHLHAQHFGTTPEAVWDILDGYGLSVFSLDGRGPHDRAAFGSVCATAQRLDYGADAETNFVARRGRTD
jgi:FkbM family methyltransferase